MCKHCDYPEFLITWRCASGWLQEVWQTVMTSMLRFGVAVSADAMMWRQEAIRLRRRTRRHLLHFVHRVPLCDVIEVQIGVITCKRNLYEYLNVEEGIIHEHAVHAHKDDPFTINNSHVYNVLCMICEYIVFTILLHTANKLYTDHSVLVRKVKWT